MDINVPLHGFVHLWLILAAVLAGFFAVAVNKLWAAHLSSGKQRAKAPAESSSDDQISQREPSPVADDGQISQRKPSPVADAPAKTATGRQISQREPSPVADERAAGITNLILGAILLLYTALWCWLCFFYRKPMAEPHLRLDPFWSYREAFSHSGIARLGVARSIALNILLTVPLGYLLPAVFRNTKHPYVFTLLTVLTLSLTTEILQYLTRTGLAETDDVINNLLGCAAGLLAYRIAAVIVQKITRMNQSRQIESEDQRT